METENMEDEGNSVTMVDVLKEQEAFEEDAKAVLGASDDKNCTYNLGYVKRQALYACLTCCPDSIADASCRAGLCLACSLACHENHDLIELYTKRNFRCDCGGPKFSSNPCTFSGAKTELNHQNQYNQNFAGLYCVCQRPYPDPDCPDDDEMIQCIVCEDWLHSRHLQTKVPQADQYSEMICEACMDKNDFLNDYLPFKSCNDSTLNDDSHLDMSLDINDTQSDINASTLTAYDNDDINASINNSTLSGVQKDDAPPAASDKIDVLDDVKENSKDSSESNTVQTEYPIGKNNIDSIPKAYDTTEEDNCLTALTPRVDSALSAGDEANLQDNTKEDLVLLNEKMKDNIMVTDTNEDFSKANEDIPTTEEDIPKTEEDIPKTEEDIPNDTGDISKANKDAENVIVGKDQNVDLPSNNVSESHDINNSGKYNEDAESKMTVEEATDESPATAALGNNITNEIISCKSTNINVPDCIANPVSSTDEVIEKEIISKTANENIALTESEKPNNIDNTQEKISEINSIEIKTFEENVSSDNEKIKEIIDPKEISAEGNFCEINTPSEEALIEDVKNDNKLNEMRIDDFKELAGSDLVSSAIESDKNELTDHVNKQSISPSTNELNIPPLVTVPASIDSTSALTETMQVEECKDAPSIREINIPKEVTSIEKVVENDYKHDNIPIDDSKEPTNPTIDNPSIEIDQNPLPGHDQRQLICPGVDDINIPSLVTVTASGDDINTKLNDTSALIETMQVDESNDTPKLESNINQDVEKLTGELMEVDETSENISVPKEDAEGKVLPLSDITDSKNIDENTDIVMKPVVQAADIPSQDNKTALDTNVDIQSEMASSDVSQPIENSESQLVDEKKRKHSESPEKQSSAIENIKKARTEITCIKPPCCVKPQRTGATFWPCDWRNKLCSCSKCMDVYQEKNVSFLLDSEDTVSAYEDLGKIKNGTAPSQYEKGMQALSSLGHVQQINAITEYNKMKEKLLEFLKTFKDKKEVVKEEDIKGFFADMKPKREPDGVYFCR